MMPVRSQVLRLYKDLLRYGETLTLTDKRYYKRRIRQEFNNNKNLSADEVEFFYKENDLEEHFIKGGGPGGQKVNKGNNCVYLVHKPSGLSVKVHESRCQAQNRKIAREKIISKLDNLVNKENSVENQKKCILKEKLRNKFQKQKKRMELKKRWKQLVCE